jgi:hypothetical protein
MKDGKTALEIVSVTNQTKAILGVACTVVQDRLSLNGKLYETATDWYAQDKAGNVWYFGEDTSESSAAWQAGVNGAQPGIYMPGHPVHGAGYFQETYPGHAVDHFQILSSSASITVPAGAYHNAVWTKEVSPLDPGVVAQKYFAPEVGMVKEFNVVGPQDVVQLASVTGE